MAYRIIYSGGERYPTKLRRRRIGWTGPIFLAVTLVVLLFMSSETAAALEQILFPGGKDVFLQIEMAALKIQEGEPVGEAIHAFCRQVISGVPG